jgi:hypothetical protein
MTKDDIIKKFATLSYDDSKGLEGLFSRNGNDEVFDRVSIIEENPISKVQMNQLFSLSGLPSMTFGFFKYYWFDVPNKHPYKVDKVEGFKQEYCGDIDSIISIDQLYWGMKRIYIDSLLYFGNITNGYKILSEKNEQELIVFFEDKRVATDKIMKRGKALDFENIPKEDRYLISEMACKTYEVSDDDENNLRKFLIDNYNAAIAAGLKKPTVKDLLDKDYIKRNVSIPQFKFSAEDFLEKEIGSPEEINSYYGEISKRFVNSRRKAIRNAKLYLSLVSDIDVYVATSMRNKKDFIDMANTCEKIFHDDKLVNLFLRYFDPTISAANGHEDKGLIECLMVRAAKVLIYIVGEKESYGKDAEAAMALSSGKPVIFLVKPEKANFYMYVHPLTRLIDFKSGVANGAIVTTSIVDLVEIIRRLFKNEMEYEIDQLKPGYFRLKEQKTNSVVRIQTNDELLSKSFWNYFYRFGNE